MREEDVPAGLRLCRAAGWNQVSEDWMELLALGGRRCLIARAGERVVGTVTVVEYQARFAWIGMVLVDPCERGQGIGTSLMRHALASLDGIPARLDATPAGYPVYASLGFEEERRLERLKRKRSTDQTGPTWSPADDVTIRPMSSSDLEVLAPVDAQAFGADRSSLLRWELENMPEFAWVVEGATRIEAYCLGRRGHLFAHIGPVVASSSALAERLVDACVRVSPFEVVGIDAPTDNAAWRACLSRLGFVAERPFVRMFRGVHASTGSPDMQFAILGPEWG